MDEIEQTQLIVRDWCFTFGHGQGHNNMYVIINGTFDSARAEMFRRYDRKWCMQYEYNDPKTQEIIKNWNMKELK